MHKYHTAIDFNGHLLTLKYKKRDVDGVKYSWTIHEEWAPEPTENILPQTTKTSTAVGLTPTPLLDTDTDNSLIISGFTTDNAKRCSDEQKTTSFTGLLETDDRALIDSVEAVGNVLVVKCKDKDSCVKIKRKHKDKQLFDCKLKWSLFDEA